MLIAEAVFKDDKNGPDVISSLADVQLGASTVTRRVSALSENLNEQLDKDLNTCWWFSIQCDESVDSSSTAQLMLFIHMVFSDSSISKYLCESAFSNVNFIKNKHRSRLTDSHLLRVAVTNYTPEYSKLVDNMECQVPH